MAEGRREREKIEETKREKVEKENLLLDQSINLLPGFKSHPKNIPRTLGTNLEERFE